MTAIITAVATRERSDVVRGAHSETRALILQAAHGVERDAHAFAEPLRPHMDAAALAQVLEFAPYASIALRAHAPCVEAMVADLRSIGSIYESINDLAAELYEALTRGSGLTLKDGTWYIDARRREWTGDTPSAADLAWDVDGLLEVRESAG